tara:strand:+ start:644 stop:856 length:213 start_codon:yes stop_codon:yes gene_type:complete
MELSAVEGVMQCRNAKPPINHAIKRKAEADLKKEIAAFKRSGGKIEKLKNTHSEQKTYKQVSDSYFGILA